MHLTHKFLNDFKYKIIYYKIIIIIIFYFLFFAYDLGKLQKLILCL